MSGTPSSGGGRLGRVPLAREGYPFIGVAVVATVLLFSAGWTVAAGVALCLTLFVVSFFRDPERVVPQRLGAIVAPADGRIIKIATVHDDRFLVGPATLVSIFMSPLNVHVNRIPSDGSVVAVRYYPGKYFRAFADKASLDNEQAAVILDGGGEGQRFCVVQIAGFIARRIVCRLHEGMTVERGERYGLIMFGSRADIYLPPNVRVTVQVGDRTVGGCTVIAEWT